MTHHQLPVFRFIPAYIVFLFFIPALMGKSPPGIIQKPSHIGAVVFPHADHTNSFDVACRSCHHSTFAAKLTAPHRNYSADSWKACIRCHTDSPPAGEIYQCSHCHDKLTANSTDLSLSTRVVVHKSCAECHEMGTGADASSQCSFCHSGPKLPYDPVQ